MRRRLQLVALGILASAAGSAVTGGKAEKTIFGSYGVRIMREADRVEIQLVDNTRKTLPPRTPWVVVDQKIATQLSTVLLDDDSYVWDNLPKPCLPRPGVQIRFVTKDKKTTTVSLCFECDILLGEEGKEDFDPARGKLAAMLKEVFPKDSVVQGL